MASDFRELSEEAQEASYSAREMAESLNDIRKEFNKLSSDGKNFSKGLERDLSSAFRSVVVEGQSLGDSLRSLALSMADRAFQSAMEPMMASFATSMVGALPFAKGGVIQGGHVEAFARGGVVQNATGFATKSGLGLMGEAGPEAILPLSRDANGELGVKSQSNQNISVHMNINTPDVGGFRKSSSQLTSELQRALARVKG